MSTFEKVSDTTFYNSQPTAKYDILHLKDKNENLLLFNSIQIDSLNNKKYKILDVLKLPIQEDDLFITIGYCDKLNQNEGNIIALVKKTKDIKIQNIEALWLANTKTKVIEELNDVTGIECFNEFYMN